jgi:hypothetical protein
MRSTALESPAIQDPNRAAMEIPQADMIFEASAGQDEVGQVFRWRGEVYRGVRREYASFYRNLLGTPLFRRLNELGIVETEITDYHTDEYDLVLKPRTIPVISYPTEWTTAMFRDAALVNCDIQLCLLKAGYTLKDGHPWNILFDGSRPVFVDLGSICEKGPEPVQRFVRASRKNFLHPLLLLHSDAASLGRIAMDTYLGLPSFPLYRLLFLLMPMRLWLYQVFMDRVENHFSKRSPESAVQWLRKQIAQIPTRPITTKQSRSESPSERETGNRKASAVAEILAIVKPQSILQIGIDKWWHPSTVARQGVRVTVTDPNESELHDLYYQARTERLNLLVLNADPIVAPPPHDLWGIHRPLHQRLKSGVVIMFDAARYLTGERRKSPDQLARALCSLVEDAAVVEYQPCGELATASRRDRCGAHSIDDFKDALRRHFTKVHVQTNFERYLLVCEGPRRKSEI